MYDEEGQVEMDGQTFFGDARRSRLFTSQRISLRICMTSRSMNSGLVLWRSWKTAVEIASSCSTSRSWRLRSWSRRQAMGRVSPVPNVTLRRSSSSAALKSEKGTYARGPARERRERRRR